MSGWKRILPALAVIALLVGVWWIVVEERPVTAWARLVWRATGLWQAIA